MADTVESLRADLDALRADFEAFKVLATPVLDGHQPESKPIAPFVFARLPPPPPPDDLGVTRRGVG